MSSTDPNQPVLRVIRGDATDEEIAALLAVLSVRAGAGAGAVVAAPAPVSTWNQRASLLRRPLPTGPGAWRASVWAR
jgi:hypothetical protein